MAKSVSLRLHSELEAVQKKNARLEWENEELRERLQDLEVAKQVLQAEMDKSQVLQPQKKFAVYTHTYTHARTHARAHTTIQKFRVCKIFNCFWKKSKSILTMLTKAAFIGP